MRSVLFTPPGDRALGEQDLLPGQIGDHSEQVVHTLDRLQQFIKEPGDLSDIVKAGKPEQLIRGPFPANGDRQECQFVELKRVAKYPDASPLCLFEFPGCLVRSHGMDGIPG